MLKRPQLAAIVVVALVSLVLLNLPDQVAARAKVLIGGCFLPLFGLMGSAQAMAGDAAGLATPRSELLRQVRARDQENQALRLELARIQAAEDENRRLRQLVGWQQASPRQLFAIRIGWSALRALSAAHRA